MLLNRVLLQLLGIGNQRDDGKNGQIRFINGTTTADCDFRRNGATALTLKANNEVQFTGYILVNNISAPDDTDLALRRDDVEFIRLYRDGTTSAEAIVCSKQLRANSQLRVNNLQINQFSSGYQYTDFRLENTNDSIMRFLVGSPNDVNLQISQYVDGNSQLINEIVLNRTTKCGGFFHTNTIDTYTDTDLLIRRNGTDVLNILLTHL